MNLFCKIFGHDLVIVDDFDVDKNGRLFQNDRGHRMCRRCKAVNWDEENYPGLGMWFDKKMIL